MACHLLPAYRRRFPDLGLPASEAAARESLLLPLFPGMTDAEQSEVAGALRAALDGELGR